MKASAAGNKLTPFWCSDMEEGNGLPLFYYAIFVVLNTQKGFLHGLSRIQACSEEEKTVVGAAIISIPTRGS
jgi:hypothetical protein